MDATNMQQWNYNHRHTVCSRKKARAQEPQEKWGPAKKCDTISDYSPLPTLRLSKLGWKNIARQRTPLRTNKKVTVDFLISTHAILTTEQFFNLRGHRCSNGRLAVFRIGSQLATKMLGFYCAHALMILQYPVFGVNRKLRKMTSRFYCFPISVIF